MAKHEHYYLVINAEGISKIVKEEALHSDMPNEPARHAYPLQADRKVWRAFKGRADLHWLCYEFELNGPLTGRMAHVIDLGLLRPMIAQGSHKSA